MMAGADSFSGAAAEETVLDLWRGAVRSFGGRPVLADAGGQLTFLELDHLARRAGRSLSGLAPPGSRVLVMLPGGRDFCAVLLGSLAAGLIAVPANADLTAHQVQWLMGDAEPAVVVAAAPPAAGGAGAVTVSPEELYEWSGAGGETRPAYPDDTALLIYTSGTSSRPKGIVCPHRSVAWAARAIDSVLRYRADDVVYMRVPMSFDYGLYQLFLCALSGAGMAFPAGRLSARELRRVRSCGATVVPVVPSLAELLVSQARLDDEPASVRLFTNTGEALTGAVADGLRTLFPGASVACMYGMSECKRITIAAPDEDAARPGTVGRPLPGTRVCVVDEDGRVLPPGAVGQIRVAGPHVMAGYYRAPWLEAGRFVPSAADPGRDLLTGDFGWMDEEGRLYFEGRRDDIFKRNGLRVSVAEVEAAVMDVPGVQAAASRQPGDDGVLTAWVVTGLDMSVLRKLVVERIGAQRAPDRYVPVERLPLTIHGKVDRMSLSHGLEKVGEGNS